MLPNKYSLYELSVQTPNFHTEWFYKLYQEVTQKEARSLREDFCGTFQMSCEWVQLHPKNTALSLDLDPEPLKYGKDNNRTKLSDHQKRRLRVVQQDVLIPTQQLSDLIIACNFSFFIFKQRELLRKYFKSCLQSLNPGGVLLLETVGGPGMIEHGRETKTVQWNKQKKFKYTWHQKVFDPITHFGQYAIHWKLWDGTILKDAFTYDWRLWSIPELREILAEAGFSKSLVYWETEHRGRGTGEYMQMENGDNAFSWIAYVLGVK
jgi:SAM-dependent methyltransferase